MPSALFLTRVTNLEIVDYPHSAEWEIMPGLHLTTNMEFLKEILTEPFVLAMGKASEIDFLNHSHFIYARLDDVQISSWFPEMQNDPMRFSMALEVIQMWLRNFLRATWLLKDNCCSCEEGFVIYPDSGTPELSTSLILHEQNLTCEGSKRFVCSISVEELQDLIRLHDVVESSLHDCRSQHGDVFQGKRARILRCMEFIHTARTSYSIPIRMVHYCSVCPARAGIGLLRW